MKFFNFVVSIVVIAYVAIIVFVCTVPSDYKQTYHKEVKMYCRSEKPYGFNASYGPEKCYSLIEIR